VVGRAVEPEHGVKQRPRRVPRERAGDQQRHRRPAKVGPRDPVAQLATGRQLGLREGHPRDEPRQAGGHRQRKRRSRELDPTESQRLRDRRGDGDRRGGQRALEPGRRHERGRPERRAGERRDGQHEQQLVDERHARPPR
jgi:hypothetical protein